MLMPGIQFTAGEHEFQLFHQQWKSLVQMVCIRIAEPASDTGAVCKVMQPVTLLQPPWFEHDQMTVAEKILLRCTWLDPAEKEARRLHLQGMTVPDYTVKVRKWFCVMCDEDYEGEKCCPRCGTGVYSRAWGRQEVPSEDARADNPLQRL